MTTDDLLQEAVALLRALADHNVTYWSDDGEARFNPGKNQADSMRIFREARAFLAKIDAEKGEESEFQVISGNEEDACIEAQTSGPRDVALREAMHYAEQYAEDGPVSVFEHIEVARLGYPSGNYGPTATPPADAALADALEHAGTRAEFHPDSEIAVLCRQAAAALRALAVPEAVASDADWNHVPVGRVIGDPVWAGQLWRSQIQGTKKLRHGDLVYIRPVAILSATDSKVKK